jgi:hypothetical protein
MTADARPEDAPAPSGVLSGCMGGMGKRARRTLGMTATCASCGGTFSHDQLHSGKCAGCLATQRQREKEDQGCCTVL